MHHAAFLIPLLLIGFIPIAFGEVVQTTGQNYDLIEDYTIGEAKWQSHPERIYSMGEWQNYVLKNTNEKVMFHSNAVGSLIYDIPSCSYSINENGFSGEQIIPSVSAIATYYSNDTWQHLPINDEACTVSTSQYEDGVILTATKVIIEDITEPVFITYTGTTENFHTNGTNSGFTLIQSSNGTNTGYFNGEVITTTGQVVEQFTQEIRMDINLGFKETFKVIHDGDQPLGISQTVHTGESITIGEQTINIAQYNGQSFDRDFIINNQAEILALTDSLNYDFDEGIKSLTNVNILFEDSKYKVNLDYANGNNGIPFVGYLEIDPTFTGTPSSETNIQASDSSPSSCSGKTVSGTYSSQRPAADPTICRAPFFTYDLTSITSATVSSASWEYDIHSTASASDCSLQGFGNTIPTADQTTYDSIVDHTITTIGASNSDCKTIGNDYTMTFNSAGIAELQSNIDTSIGSYSLAHYWDSTPQTDDYWIRNADAVLSLTYSLPLAPNAPTNLSTITGIPIEIDWDATPTSGNGGSPITSYKVFRTLNEFALTELPDNSGSDSQIDFTDNELLVHGIESTNYKVHTFTGSSTFQVTSGSGNVEYLVIGGGGGGYCGGGGSGDYRTATGHAVTTQSYSVTVGGGGSAGNCNVAGTHSNGGTSSFDSIISIGGGAGAGTDRVGSNGGSGGGSGGGGSSTNWSGGTSTAYGNDGGDRDSAGSLKSAGGGGAATRGQHSSEASSSGANGGNGLTSSITGTAVVRSGGGAGALIYSGTAGTGGTGGGGNYDTNGATNTGSGGGGASVGTTAGTGGSGVVIVKYLDDGSITATGGTVTSITDSSITDSSTNGITVTETTPATSTTGTIGNAIDNPDLTYTHSTLPSGTNDFSIGGWVELDEGSATTTATGSYTWIGDIGTYDNNHQGAYVATSNSVLNGKTIDSISFWLHKTGSPTGTATVGVWSNSGSGTTVTLAHTFGTFDVSTLTGSQAKHTFDTGSYTLGVGDTIGIYSPTTSVSNTVEMAGALSDQFDGTDTVRARTTANPVTWSPVSSHDIKFEVTESVPPSNTKLLGINDITFSVNPTSASVENTATSTTIISATTTDNTVTPKHYAFTRDGNSWKVFQDGSQVGSTVTDSTSLGSNTGVDYTTTLDGTLDEYFIDSTALTGTEIDTIYERGVAPSLLATTSAGTTNYDDGTVTGGNTYFFTVQSVNSVGSSPSITPMVSGLAGTPPDPPTGVSASIPNPNTAPLGVTINWSSPSNVGSGTLTGFELFRDNVLITTTGLVTTYSDTVPTGGGTFVYSMKAISNHGTSILSATSSVTTPTVPATPTVPTGSINNPNSSPLDVTVSWVAPGDGGSSIVNYDLYRSATSGSGFAVVQSAITGLTHTDTVSSSGVWYYTVVANNLIGASAQSPELTITTPTVPSAISDLAGSTVSDTAINLTWSAPNNGGSNIVDYDVLRDGVTIATVSTPGYSDVSLTTQTSYVYEIFARNNVGFSLISNQVTQETHGIPDQVSPFTASTAAIDQLDLSWTAPNDYNSPITSYIIERESPIGGGFTALVTLGVITSYSDVSLSTLTEYNYRITAVNNYGNSPTNTASTITLPAAPTNVLVTPSSSASELLITWDEPLLTTGITGYQIQRENGVGTGFTPITISTGTNYTDTSLSTNVYYNYKLASVTVQGNSAYSNTYSQTTFHLPDAVTSLTATSGELIDAGLAWSAPAVPYGYITGYEIYQSTTGIPNVLLDSITGTIYTATNLDPTIQYSWMVSPITIHGGNTTGNIANATAVSVLIIGDIELSTDTNPDTIPINFQKIVIGNNTDVIVNYDSSLEVTCEVSYVFARTDTTYPSLSETPTTGSRVSHTMTFTDSNNDIIDIYCYDVIDNSINGKERINQATMPFVTQVTNFQTGMFGTDGGFGVFDLTTLAVVIVSMIGFNRKNPAVGVGIMVALIGALGYYGIIELPTVLMGAIALIVILSIGVVRNR